MPTPVSTPTLGSVTDVDEKLQARIAVSGDTGTRNAAQARVARRMAVEAKKEPYDAFIISGDLVYPDGDSSLTRRSVIDPYAPVLKDATLIPALGNHDVQSGEGMDILKRLGRDSAWYVEKIGPVRVIVLDSNRIGNAKQTAWLRKVLAEEQPRGTWTIAAMHHPAYSAGDHGSDENVQRRWVPLFEQAGVELVVAGHDHDYQRSNEIDGITYIVSGGGAKLREGGRESFTAMSVGGPALRGPVRLRGPTRRSCHQARRRHRRHVHHQALNCRGVLQARRFRERLTPSSCSCWRTTSSGWSSACVGSGGGRSTDSGRGDPRSWQGFTARYTLSAWAVTSASS